MTKLIAAAVLAGVLVVASGAAADAKDSQWGKRHHHVVVAKDSQWG